MTAHDTEIRFVARHEDESWSPTWTPSRTLGEDGNVVAWEDLTESEFLAYRFRANALLTISGQDFSSKYIPVVDFALAWSWVPKGLDDEPQVETAMTAVGLVYRFQRQGDQGDQVRISSDVHPGVAVIGRSELVVLVDQIVTRAFNLLFHAHPQLRQNRYLQDVRHRSGLA